MPFVALVFEPSTDASMRDTVNRIASGSSFEPQSCRFYVPVLGSLHEYGAESVTKVIRGLACWLRGRFLRWEIRGTNLQVAVEIDNNAGFIKDLRTDLQRGRPWKKHSVALGSVAAIEESRREEFLKAVAAAFPIDQSMIFETAQLEYFERPPQNATARFSPCDGGKSKSVAPASKRSVIKKRSKSKHRKWERSTARGTNSRQEAMVG